MAKIYSEPKRTKTNVLREAAITTVSALLVLLALIGVIIVYVMKPSPPSRAPDSLIPLVRTSAVKIYSGPLYLTLSGTVVPHREVKISAEVPGLIVEKSPQCRSGQFVRAGTPLLSIDRQNYELELQTIAAELSQSETMICETDEEIRGLEEMITLAKSELDLLRAEVERNSRLTNVVSRTEADQAERSLLTSQMQLSSRENNLRMAQARRQRMAAGVELTQRRLDRAQLNLERTQIVAPADGVIVSENVQLGDLVAVGTTLVLFEDTQTVEVVTDLTATELAWIRQNVTAGVPGKTSEEFDLEAAYQLPRTPVKVYDPREPEIEWSGILSRYDGIGRDQRTKTIPVRIAVDQPVVTAPTGPRPLVRGMYVKCRIEVSAAELSNQDRLLAFPLKAIKPGGVVWLADTLQLVKRRVKVIHQVELPGENGETESYAVVRLTDGGIRPGQQVVVSPLSQPTEGAVVQLVNSPTNVASTATGESDSQVIDSGSAKLDAQEQTASELIESDSDAPEKHSKDGAKTRSSPNS